MESDKRENKDGGRFMKRDLLQEEVNTLICREKGETFLRLYQEILEKERKEIFLDGYRYAIQILEEGLVKDGKK